MGNIGSVATAAIRRLFGVLTGQQAQSNPVMNIVRTKAQHDNKAGPAHQAGSLHPTDSASPMNPTSPNSTTTSASSADSRSAPAPAPQTGLMELAVAVSRTHPLTDAFSGGRSTWKNKMKPTKWPTWEEYERAVEMTKDPEGRFFHFGISGTVKSGKSSIINSLRGLGLTDTLAADVDPNECTRVVTRYEDPRPDHPFAWACSPWIVSSILSTTASAKTTRSSYDIRNLKDDRGLEHGEAVSKYTQDASKNALSGLSSFSPPKQRCYLVNKIDLLVCGEQLSENAIHEKELVLDVLGECKRCRLYGSRFRGVTSARVPTGPYTLKVFCRNQ